MEANPIEDVHICGKCGCRICAHHYLYLCRTYGNASLCSGCREGELYLAGNTSENERIRDQARNYREPKRLEMFPDCCAWKEALKRKRETEGPSEKGGQACS